MYLIRDIMYCKPGHVRSMVDKFRSLGRIIKKKGFAEMRIMTDVSAERYWTVVTEQEVTNIDDYMKVGQTLMENKDFQKAMKGYHDHVDFGRREIYQIER